MPRSSAWFTHWVGSFVFLALACDQTPTAVPAPAAGAGSAAGTEAAPLAGTSPAPRAGAAVAGSPMGEGGTSPIAGTGQAAGTAAPAQGTSRVTYHKDIRPLLEVRCLGCHVEGGSGPFPLDSWDAVEPFAALVVDAVVERRMPPWLADSTDCRKLRFDQRLSDAQLALFEQWQAGEFPAGDASTYVPIVEPEVADPGEPTIVTTASRPHQLRANNELYVCLQMEVRFSTDTFVTAMDLVPEHEAYVHHAIVSSGSGACSALGTLAENIYSYRPGAQTLVFDPGDALLIPAGSRLAVQFHYNTLAIPRGEPAPTDLSQFRLWTLPEGEVPERVITRYPFPDTTIRIPAGSTDATAGGSVRMTTASSPPGGGWVPGEIIGITPHMHALGRSFSESLSRSGESICLINVPKWDWEWQLDYFFEADDVVPIRNTDRIVQRCQYSNTAEDQPIVDGVRKTPRYTRFGQDSDDEMCLGYIWFRYNWSDLR